MEGLTEHFVVVEVKKVFFSCKCYECLGETVEMKLIFKKKISLHFDFENNKQYLVYGKQML